MSSGSLDRNGWRGRFRNFVVRPPLRPLLITAIVSLNALPSSGQDPPLQLRRPIALALSADGALLVTANQRSGTISVIDCATLKVLGERQISSRPSDIIFLPDNRHLLALDEQDHQLLVLARKDAEFKIVDRLTVNPYPVSLTVSEDGAHCFVASLWSRSLTVVELPRQEDTRKLAKPRIEATIDLPFAPREQLVIDHGARLLVADSFGGKVGLINLTQARLESVRVLPGHNIRGLAQGPDGREILISQQLLSPLATTAFDDIHWGLLMANVLRSIRISAVLNPEADLMAETALSFLGDTGHAAGDPGVIAVSSEGTVALALSGVGEIAVRRKDAAGFHLLQVGRRPTELLVDGKRDRLYVANTFSDSISIVDLESERVESELALGPAPELASADVGELLFFDATLSHDGWMSCQSCHTDGHSNGLLADTQGDESFGAPKRVLSLLGVSQTGPWAWNGSMSDLEEQIGKSISQTMHGKQTEEASRHLRDFLGTLVPPPPADRLRQKSDPEQIGRGERVFQARECQRCHEPPLYTEGKTFDVGLVDEIGNTRFNPPSLRGLSQRDAFFHDSRASNLEEVFNRHRHQLDAALSQEDLTDLLAFLRSL